MATRQMILALRGEAYAAGDFHLAGVCELAIDRRASAHDAAMKATLRGRIDIFGLLNLANGKDIAMSRVVDAFARPA